MSKQPSKSNFKTRPLHSEDISQQSIFDQSVKALETLQQLFKMRLIDRIARPRDRNAKQQELNAFAQKLQVLHDRMFKIKDQIETFRNADNRSQQTKKGIFGSSNNNINLDLKKYIRSIEAKYSEILIYGSFRYCRKVCQTFNLKYSARLSIMMVDQWANSCLEVSNQESCC